MPDLPRASMDNANVHDWFDFWTDPGTVAIIAFGALLLPFLVLLLASKDMAQLILSMYTVYAGSVVACLGGHAVTDYGKTREMMKQKQDPGDDDKDH